MPATALDIQTPRSNISNKRWNVSPDIQTLRSSKVFCLIFKHLEVIYQTREGVFHHYILNIAPGTMNT